MMQARFSFPVAVRQLAFENGVHNDCVIAGAKGACPACVRILVEALLGVYGDIHGRNIEMIVRAAALDAAAEEVLEQP